MKVACHQPNFIPWMGFFSKMYHSDVFILLDDVQFTQGHCKHNWTTRVKIMSNAGESWITMPVNRSGKGKISIKELEICLSNGKSPAEKILSTIRLSYSRTKFFHKYYSDLEQIMKEHKSGYIAQLNIKIIKWLASVISITTVIKYSSDFKVDSLSTQRLVDLTIAAGGDTYICGGGADSYQDAKEFERQGIILKPLNFMHPIYQQHNNTDFLPGLSIIDALFNVGAENLNRLLKGSSGIL